MSANPKLTDSQIISIIVSSTADGCALMRLADHLGLDKFKLMQAADMVGWSWQKANGVMDGWDMAAGKPALHLHYAADLAGDRDYQSGIAIGAHCFRKIEVSSAGPMFGVL